MSFDYKRYLASREWALKKEAVRKRSEGRCERCHIRDYQSTHHLTYANLGHEPLEDLLGVCNPCHEYLSAKRHDDPALTISGKPDPNLPPTAIPLNPEARQQWAYRKAEEHGWIVRSDAQFERDIQLSEAEATPDIAVHDEVTRKRESWERDEYGNTVGMYLIRLGNDLRLETNPEANVQCEECARFMTQDALHLHFDECRWTAIQKEVRSA